MKKKIETPVDIYDNLFWELSLRMKEYRANGNHADAEQVLRIIEFLEKHLGREESRETYQA